MSRSRRFIAFFYPERCPYCCELVEKNEIACESCNERIVSQSVPINRGAGGYRCVASYSYEGLVRRAIVNFKFNNMTQYGRQLASVMLKSIREVYGDFDIDMVTYVPMHKKDLRKRGYNQSKILAKEIAKQLSLPCVETLKKTKLTKKQHKLTPSERRRNLSGAFTPVDKETVKGKTILLIDDVITTGATLERCCKKLNSAKPSMILCAALASAAEHEKPEGEEKKKPEQ